MPWSMIAVIVVDVPLVWAQADSIFIFARPHCWLYSGSLITAVGAEVLVGVWIRVLVEVMVGVLVMVGVILDVGVLVAVNVLVKVGVLLLVAVSVGVIVLVWVDVGG